MTSEALNEVIELVKQCRRLTELVSLYVHSNINDEKACQLYDVWIEVAISNLY
jgi:hypothetical protein